MHAIVKNKLLVTTYVLTLIFALHYGIPLYATSSFLHQYFNATWVSSLYMLGSVVALLGSLSVSRYIRQFHLYHFTATLAIAEMIILAAMPFSQNPILIGLFFIVHILLQTLLYIALNIFIESFSKHADTGSIRGFFLALFNIGILISPIVGGAVLSIGSFQALYIVAAVILIPFLAFMKTYLVHIKEPAYDRINMIGALRIAWKDKNLRAALMANFVVQSFYSVMIIYSPIYLETIGIPLPVYLGQILPFALIPLVVLPYELGYLADKKLGEKELLVAGLLILAITTFLCVVVQIPNVALWVLILLASRVGAAFVETMTFTYYFKKIGPQDASLAALFSNSMSFATIAVGAVGVVAAPFFVNYPQLMFILLGVLILWSIFYVLPMRDTR